MSAEVIQPDDPAGFRPRRRRGGVLSDSEFLFAICQLLILPERERLKWVRQCERKYGFWVLGKAPTKKKSDALKLAE
jgi:hypothetical protein